MRLAGIWTMAMSGAVAVLGTCVCWTLLGGGFVAWLAAIPGMFLFLHVVGLPLVFLCELAEKVRLLPRRWRTIVCELLAVAVLLSIAWYVLPKNVFLVAASFFFAMYVFRAVIWKCWIPGEPVEVGS